MLNKKLTEKNRSYLYEQTCIYDSDLSDEILSADVGYLCNVLSKESFWKLCKLVNDYGIRI
jgi:hypothetical protein